VRPRPNKRAVEPNKEGIYVEIEPPYSDPENVGSTYHRNNGNSAHIHAVQRPESVYVKLRSIQMKCESTSIFQLRL
jgi:hypothetical protein